MRGSRLCCGLLSKAMSIPASVAGRCVQPACAFATLTRTRSFFVGLWPRQLRLRRLERTAIALRAAAPRRSKLLHRGPDQIPRCPIHPRPIPACRGGGLPGHRLPGHEIPPQLTGFGTSRADVLRVVFALLICLLGLGSLALYDPHESLTDLFAYPVSHAIRLPGGLMSHLRGLFRGWSNRVGRGQSWAYPARTLPPCLSFGLRSPGLTIPLSPANAETARR